MIRNLARYNKLWAALIIGALNSARVYFDMDFAVDEATVTAIVSILTGAAVYQVRNA